MLCGGINVAFSRLLIIRYIIWKVGGQQVSGVFFNRCVGCQYRCSRYRNHLLLACIVPYYNNVKDFC